MHKKYFDWLAGELGIKQKEDWFEVTSEQIRQHKGEGLLVYYGNSVAKALKTIYPEQFKAEPVSSWSEVKTHRCAVLLFP